MANVIEFIVVLILIILALILVVHAIRSPKNFLVAILIEIPFGLIENILYQITFYQIEIDISSKIKHLLRIEDKLNIQEKPDFNYSGVKE